jgi:SH3-like domain-containing protein
MKNRSFFVQIMVVALLLTSCNMPQSTPTSTPVPTTVPPTATEAAPQPTDTPAATFTAEPTAVPTVAPTDTPSVPVVTPIDEPVNCRFGPGTEYAPIGFLLVGENAQVFGKTSDGEWWQVQNPDDSAGKRCWVAATVTSGAGNFSAVGVVDAPATFVTAVTLTLDPAKIELDNCSDPIEPIQIKAAIETNGPVTVKWHFETQQGGAVPEDTLDADEFGPHDVSEKFTPNPVKNGTFWIRLIVTSPSEITREVKYEIECS